MGDASGAGDRAATGPEMAPVPAPEQKPPTEEAETPAPALTKLHLYGLALVIGGILLTLLIVIGQFDSERDTVTGVLGVVIPAFATIGAALFGITVGYSAGESKGTAAGEAKGKDDARAEGEAAKEQAAADGREETASVVKRLLPAPDAVERVCSALPLASPAYSSQLLYDPNEAAPAPPEFELADMAAAENIRKAHSYLDEVLADPGRRPR
jgi:hypothetical protein